MKTLRDWTLLAVFFLTAGTGILSAEADEKDGEKEKERPVQLYCPMTGRQLADIQEPTVVDLQGFRFRVADAAAAIEAKKDAKKTFEALAKNKDAAEPISRACPVMGGLINRKEHYARDGRRVYVCCRGCIARVERRWAETLTKLAEQAEKGDPENLTAM